MSDFLILSFRAKRSGVEESHSIVFARLSGMSRLFGSAALRSG